MYKNLVMYRNELKNSIVPRYKVVGIVSELLNSKELFLKNVEISEFLNDIFLIKYKDYVMKSRTLIIARCCRMILNCDESEYNILKRKLFQFITKTIDDIKNGNNIKEKNQFNGWISGSER